MKKIRTIIAYILVMHSSMLGMTKFPGVQDTTEDLIASLVIKRNGNFDLKELYNTCAMSDILYLNPKGDLYTKLISKIKHDSWYKILETYDTTTDIDFSYLKFLTQNDYDMPDQYGNIVIHVLAQCPHNYLALKYALGQLRNKAAVNHQNFAGDTPLHWARGPNKELLQAFSGINTGIKNHFGDKAIN